MNLCIYIVSSAVFGNICINFQCVFGAVDIYVYIYIIWASYVKRSTVVMIIYAIFSFVFGTVENFHISTIYNIVSLKDPLSP